MPGVLQAVVPDQELRPLLARLEQPGDVLSQQPETQQQIAPITQTASTVDVQPGML
ncbi:hypothetical protein EV643_11418 [Kribbella sp. VKM Ac-2527]|uniref:Uncharacterized protein n=1 Tax=Kribbella caucasensis TaxID=2512215 RepID=A0A4R6K7A6_9ACTN|nr:hypothetical protein [Kribbella sp. VKM Ac-2527]TDO44873.1 hypothetical protein EV643_11418 [Kribbella sp. VKM Ac-2527]